jgi:AraC-like DNA-binding protein
VTRRHLSRLVTEYLGIGPKALPDLHRLGRSLRAVQAGTGDGAEGFSDQAHQIREWRRRLGKTPGRYSVEGRSKLAEAFDPAVSELAFYL